VARAAHDSDLRRKEEHVASKKKNGEVERLQHALGEAREWGLRSATRAEGRLADSEHTLAGVLNLIRIATKHGEIKKAE
jgi:hypothetical protein